MEKKLQALFDYQQFEQNEDLAAVIDAVHARYQRRTLSEEELDWVNAAGDAKYLPPEQKPGKEQEK